LGGAGGKEGNSIEVERIEPLYYHCQLYLILYPIKKKNEPITLGG